MKCLLGTASVYILLFYLSEVKQSSCSIIRRSANTSIARNGNSTEIKVDSSTSLKIYVVIFIIILAGLALAFTAWFCVCKDNKQYEPENSDLYSGSSKETVESQGQIYHVSSLYNIPVLSSLSRE